ncbi:MAG: putative protein N(5)-glutamine methyltransferase [Micrococcales bacterium]|nr:putative protein N(5)-glutamine methyltransferase [Micrococcales bacterium]
MDDLVATLRAAGCVFAEEEAALLRSHAGDQLGAWTARRTAGEPLEQIVGWAAFRGLRLVVAPGVFVPRARTGAVVDAAAAVLRPGDLVVDLCCGTGALGAALVAAVPGVVVHATDIDPVAVACARTNLGPAGVVHCGDLDEPLPSALRGQVAAVVANAPYVPTDQLATMPVEARVHERRTALDGGTDGLDVVRRVLAAARGWLRPGGTVVVETSPAQASALTRTCTSHGLTPRVVVDPSCDATVVVATANV